MHAARPSWLALLVQWILRLASVPYWLCTWLRNLLYDFGLVKSQRVALPIICIGNLSVGGTGKTPMVAWVCKWLRERDIRVAIVSRGYGQLDSGRNDEALELELLLPDVPHLQNPDRVAASSLALNELEMQAVVLDDGFQHRRLARDLDIVLIDASQPSSTDWVLPGGLMREPWSALRRAEVIILSRANLAAPGRLAALRRRITQRAPEALCIEADHAAKGLHGLGCPWQSLEELDGQSVLAFCGIGNPTGFLASLKKQNVADQRIFPDHHAFSSSDVQGLNEWATEHPECGAVVCTMKDWVKLQVSRLGPLPLVAVQISMVFSAEDEEHLATRLAKLVPHS